MTSDTASSRISASLTLSLCKHAQPSAAHAKIVRYLPHGGRATLAHAAETYPLMFEGAQQRADAFKK